MTTIDSTARRALRARAHHLHPVVSVGQQGLTPAVLREIDIALKAHELIKVRVFVDDRDAREALLTEICTAADAAPVQHLGKLLVIWRPNPEEKMPTTPRARPTRKTPAPKDPARKRRDAPPAGVPRAALPRRRRARG